MTIILNIIIHTMTCHTTTNDCNGIGNAYHCQIIGVDHSRRPLALGRGVTCLAIYTPWCPRLQCVRATRLSQLASGNDQRPCQDPLHSRSFLTFISRQSISHSYTHLILALGIVREPTVWGFITSK